MLQSRPGSPFRDDLALPMLEGRELFQRIGELLRAGYLSVRVLHLQEAIQCGDERAGDMVCL